jgi:hypothetical protein
MVPAIVSGVETWHNEAGHWAVLKRGGGCWGNMLKNQGGS